MNHDGIEIVYDGECPFCASYVRLVRLREAVGKVELIDARSGDPRVAQLRDAGYDLEAGMAVRYRGEVSHGAQAVNVLAILSAPTGMANRLLSKMLRSPRIAAALYPSFVRIRRLTLRLLGRSALS